MDQLLEISDEEELDRAYDKWFSLSRKQRRRIGKFYETHKAEETLLDGKPYWFTLKPIPSSEDEEEDLEEEEEFSDFTIEEEEEDSDFAEPEESYEEDRDSDFIEEEESMETNVKEEETMLKEVVTNDQEQLFIREQQIMYGESSSEDDDYIPKKISKEQELIETKEMLEQVSYDYEEREFIEKQKFIYNAIPREREEKEDDIVQSFYIREHSQQRQEEIATERNDLRDMKKEAVMDEEERKFIEEQKQLWLDDKEEEEVRNEDRTSINTSSDPVKTAETDEEKLCYEIRMSLPAYGYESLEDLTASIYKLFNCRNMFYGNSSELDEENNIIQYYYTTYKFEAERIKNICKVMQIQYETEEGMIDMATLQQIRDMKINFINSGILNEVKSYKKIMPKDNPQSSNTQKDSTKHRIQESVTPQNSRKEADLRKEQNMEIKLQEEKDEKRTRVHYTSVNVCMKKYKSEKTVIIALYNRVLIEDFFFLGTSDPAESTDGSHLVFHFFTITNRNYEIIKSKLNKCKANIQHEIEELDDETIRYAIMEKRQLMDNVNTKLIEPFSTNDEDEVNQFSTSPIETEKANKELIPQTNANAMIEPYITNNDVGANQLSTSPIETETVYNNQIHPTNANVIAVTTTNETKSKDKPTKADVLEDITQQLNVLQNMKSKPDITIIEQTVTKLLKAGYSNSFTLSSYDVNKEFPFIALSVLTIGDVPKISKQSCMCQTHGCIEFFHNQSDRITHRANSKMVLYNNETIDDKNGIFASMLACISNLKPENYGFLVFSTYERYNNVKPMTKCPFCNFACNCNSEFWHHLSSKHNDKEDNKDINGNDIAKLGYFWTYMLSKDSKGNRRVFTTPEEYFDVISAYKCNSCDYICTEKNNMMSHVRYKHTTKIITNGEDNAHFCRGLAGTSSQLSLIQEKSVNFANNIKQNALLISNTNNCIIQKGSEAKTDKNDANQENNAIDNRNNDKSCPTTQNDINNNAPNNMDNTPDKNNNINVSDDDNLANEEGWLPQTHGLLNPSNLCFMNSIIQALYLVDKIRVIVLKSTSEENNIFQELKKIFTLLGKKNNIKYNLSECSRIFQNLKLDPNTQEDVHVPLMSLIYSNNELYNTCKLRYKEFSENTQVSEKMEEQIILDLHFDGPKDPMEDARRAVSIQDMFDSECEPKSIQYEEKEAELLNVGRVQMITNTSDIIIGYIVRQDYNNGTKKRMFEVMLNQYISILNSIYILRTCTCHIGANANYGHYVTYYFNGTHSTCINDSIIEDGSFILNDGIWRNLNNRQTVSIVIYERIGDNSDPMSLTNNIVNNETQAVEEHHTEQQKYNPIRLEVSNPFVIRDDPSEGSSDESSESTQDPIAKGIAAWSKVTSSYDSSQEVQCIGIIQPDKPPNPSNSGSDTEEEPYENASNLTDNVKADSDVPNKDPINTKEGNVITHTLPIQQNNLEREDQISTAQAIKEASEFVHNLADAEEEMEYTKLLTEAKTKRFWGSHPELLWEEDLMDVNIIALSMVRGTAPTDSSSLICGYPCCPKWFTNQKGRSKHWKEAHKNHSKYHITWFNTICNMLGINIISRRERCKDHVTEIIEHPPIRCPLCAYVSCNLVTLGEHLKSEHNLKKEYFSTMETVRWNKIWSSQEGGFTLRNIIFQGTLFGCPKCGFGSKDANSVFKHHSQLHREVNKPKEYDKYTYFTEIRQRFYQEITPIYGFRFETIKTCTYYNIIRSTAHNENVSDPPQRHPALPIQAGDPSIPPLSIAAPNSLCRPNSVNNQNATPKTSTNTNPPTQTVTPACMNNKQSDNLESQNSSSSTQLTQSQSNNQTLNQASSTPNNDQMIPDHLSTQKTNEAPSNQTSRSNENRTNQTLPGHSPSIQLTENEILQALEWNKMYHNLQAQIPKMKPHQRSLVQEAMRCALEDKCIPLLTKILQAYVDPEISYEVINGYISYTHYIIINEISRCLGIRNTRLIRNNKYIVDNDLEIELSRRMKSKSAGERIAASLAQICLLNENSNISDQVRLNQTREWKARIHNDAQLINDTMRQHVFKNGIVDDRSIDEIVSDPERRDGIMRYLSSAEDKDIASLNKRKQEKNARKVQSMYRTSAKRAMRYFIDRHPTPSCEIPIQDVTAHFGQQWNKESGYLVESGKSDWTTTHKLSEEDREYLLNYLSNEESLREIIKSRDSQSAHGPDGIGYWALQARVDLSAKYLSLLSKIIVKYEFMPSIWNNARTILLYKSGDGMDLKNWRPLTIAPCLYRTWTCAIANALQDVNKNSTPLFNQNQKGFIRGIDGCLEHSRIAVELFNDANRRHKNLYALAIDLRDAFGSVPHGYIKEILREMDFPSEVLNVISRAYDDGYTKVRIGNQEGQRIHIGQGVKQGCPLSPLIFNFCLNPLLEALETHGSGYYISNSVDENVSITVQAYADDLILFSETREGMERNIRILEQFLHYSKLVVNCSKCHSISYIINRDHHRDYDNKPFVIENVNIHCTTLAEGITYLGTTTATTNRIREHGSDEAIREVINLINNISASPLTISQKIHAIKTFAIPKLDYVLTDGKVQLKKMEEIDTLIRKCIRSHINANIPSEIFYCHWKDGGFSLTPLHERAYMLRIKTFMSLFNSPNEKTKFMMREFADRERRFRGIEIRNPGTNCNQHDKYFLNWLIGDRYRSGTDTITIKAKEACDHFNITLKLIDSDPVIVINSSRISLPVRKAISNADSPGAESSDDEVREIKDANEAVTANRRKTQEEEEDTLIENPKLIPRTIMSIIRKQMQEKLTDRQAVGHSFRNIKNAPYANHFIGNQTCALNDNIVTWIIKARSNMLINGSLCTRHRLRNMITYPRCPYCGEQTKDTIHHRINSCNNNKVEKKKRHNMVQNIILKELTKKFGQHHVSIDHGVNINGQQVEAPFNTLRPDLIAWDENNIHIIEFTIPYDHLKEDHREAMEIAYTNKVNKYKGLVVHCRTQFKMNVDLTVVVVSSLGAVFKKSVKELRKLLGLANKKGTSPMNKIMRRMSIAACIGSYFIYYNLKFSESNRHRGLDDSDDAQTDTSDTANITNISDSSTTETQERDNIHVSSSANESDLTCSPNNDSSMTFVDNRMYRNNEPIIILPDDESTDAEVNVLDNRGPLPLTSRSRTITHFRRTTNTHHPDQRMTSSQAQDTNTSSDDRSGNNDLATQTPQDSDNSNHFRPQGSDRI